MEEKIILSITLTGNGLTREELTDIALTINNDLAIAIGEIIAKPAITDLIQKGLLKINVDNLNSTFD